LLVPGLGFLRAISVSSVIAVVILAAEATETQ
jgi:hypothetical protein